MYGNLEKTRWRKEMWDNAAAVCDKSKYVIALSGQRFLDRKEAIRRGWSEDKVVGVDIDKGVEAHNVELGRTVVGLPLGRFMLAWERPTTFISADYCAGLGNPDVTNTLGAWITKKNYKDSFMMVNVAVGREVGVYHELVRHTADAAGVEMRKVHRGALAVMRGVFGFLLNCVRLGNGGSIPEEEAARLASHILDTAELQIGSYLARKTRMDWIALAHPGTLEDIMLSLGATSVDSTVPQTDTIKAAKRTIAAKMAWNTMKAQPI